MIDGSLRKQREQEQQQADLPLREKRRAKDSLARVVRRRRALLASELSTVRDIREPYYGRKHIHKGSESIQTTNLLHSPRALGALKFGATRRVYTPNAVFHGDRPARGPGAEWPNALVSYAV